jgi:sugar/nucleoside kinase (ribokinase family)
MNIRWDVLGLGSATVDDLLYVDSFPTPDTKMPAQSIQRHGGGLTATGLVAVARLGARAAFAGVLGHDETSRWVEDDLKREGVDVSQVVHYEDAKPIHAVIIVEQEKRTRTILYAIPGRVGADEHRPSEDIIRSTRVLYVDDFGMAGHIRAAKIARREGIPIVGDFEREQTPRLPELIDLVDHLIVSAGFAARYAGLTDPTEAARKLWHDRRAMVAVTCGEEGSWYYTGEGKPRQQPAFHVAVVDTTGCGDVFHGAYAAALTWDMSLEERIRFASATAALKATQPGGRQGIPGREQVQAFLREQGKS